MDAMDEERFKRLIETYGGESARWPQAERAPALRFLAANPSAHATRAEAWRLDQMLDAWAPDSASGTLAARIAASAPAPRVLRPRELWISGVGLAAACLIGVMVGAGFGAASLNASPPRNSDAETAAVTAALDGAPAQVPALDEGSS
ncbi:MAG TPA: hypothetical protein VE309_02055 [Caulobacteraceae bacterium]|jgi:hypothetical protein|nr:hypothetical protein [Caulobacteraceae bacterium]